MAMTLMMVHNCGSPKNTFDPFVSHANWEKTGIVPDVEAYADWDTFLFETDPSVAAALSLLGHK